MLFAIAAFGFLSVIVLLIPMLLPSVSCYANYDATIDIIIVCCLRRREYGERGAVAGDDVMMTLSFILACECSVCGSRCAR